MDILHVLVPLLIYKQTYNQPWMVPQKLVIDAYYV